MQERVKAKNNMYGALTLPSVSTGFTSDSKAMVPVSIQGMAGKLQKISTFVLIEIQIALRGTTGTTHINFQLVLR